MMRRLSGSQGRVPALGTVLATLGLALAGMPPLRAQTITTLAGTDFVAPSLPLPAPQYPFSSISSLVSDSKGNIYIADAGMHRIFKVDTSGNLALFAGNGSSISSGDGGQAPQAGLGQPVCLAVDPADNIYVVQWGNFGDFVNDAVRRIALDGTILTVWIAPTLQSTRCVVFDSAANMYVSSGNQVFRVAADGTASAVAGNGQGGSSGDGGPATAASLGQPSAIAMDSAGDMYISDVFYRNIRKVSAQGIITTLWSLPVGSALFGTWGNFADFVNDCLTVDPRGVVYTCAGNQVASITPAGALTIVAGNGASGWAGDGGAALAAELSAPAVITSDRTGVLYVADSINVVRKFSPGGIISHVAGSGQYSYSGDGGPAAFATMNSPYSVAVDGSGNVYFSDQNNARVRKISPSGIVITVAGNGRPGYSGDSGPAAGASFDAPAGLALDTSGDLYVADSRNSAVRKISPEGVTTAFAGTGKPGYGGDGGPATSALLNGPTGLALDSHGNLYIADTGNCVVRAVSPAGTISTAAGSGCYGYSGDGGAATAASFSAPTGLAFDSNGNLYIGDPAYSVVRKVTPEGIITTAAGSEPPGYGGDGGPATKAHLLGPIGLAVDASGDLLIADTGNNAIRRVASDGTITTLVGDGTSGYSGDGGPAANALLNRPQGVAIGTGGDVYIADTGNNRIRAVYGPSYPIFLAAGLANAASYAGGVLVPGSIAAVFGTNLNASSGVVVAQGVPLPPELAGVSVLVNGSAAPIFAIAYGNQVNFQVPWEVAGQASASVQIVNAGVAGPVVWMPVAPAQPGIFAGTGGFAAILHASNYQLVDSAHPAVPGEVLLVYATGLGTVSASHQPATGSAASGAASTTAVVTVTIGGIAASVLYGGLAPGFVGLYQINVTVPLSLTSGYRPVVISMGGVTSNTAVLPVAAPLPTGTSQPPGGSFQVAGPEGAIFTSLAVDPSNPSTIYAGAQGGVWKSTDGASTWHRVGSDGTVGEWVFSLVVTGTGAIYAGPFRSTDGGTTWTALPVPGQNAVVQFAVDPLNEQTLYALTQQPGLYRSLDGGTNWAAVQIPASCALNGTFAVDTATEGKLYYGTCSGFYVSIDAGSTWTLSINAVQPNYSYPSYFALAPSDPTHIYAVFQWPGLTVSQLYSSADGAATWTYLGVDNPSQFAINPNNAEEVFVSGQPNGLFDSEFLKTTNGGSAWHPTGQPPPSAGGYGLLVLLPTSPSTLLAQGGNRLWRTVDEGEQWTDASSGVSAAFGYQVVVDPQNPSTIYLVAQNGVGLTRTTDGGKTWAPLATYGEAMAVDPFDSGHLMASDFSSGLWSSQDGGSTWQIVHLPQTVSPGTPSPFEIVFDQTSPGAIYLVFGNFACGGSCQPNDYLNWGVLKSTDGGSTWSMVNKGLTTTESLYGLGLAIDPRNPNTLVLATQGGIYKSTDAGGNWTLKGSTSAYDIVFDPNHAGSVYAPGQGLLLKSSDDGETWTLVDIGRGDLSGPFTVTVDPEAADNLFLASFDRTPFSGGLVGWSPDGGQTWTWLSSGLGSDLLGGNVRSSTIAMTKPEVLYLASPTAGLIALPLTH